MKIVGKILLWIVGIVVALVVTLPLWISPVARIAANIAVPKVTGAPFHLDRFNLSADWFSLATDTIVVKDITVGGLFYEQKLSMPTLPFGGKKDAADKKDAPKAEAPAKRDEPKSEKKIIIDHLLLEDIVISVHGLKLPPMKLELSGIGRKSNGVTLEEAWNQISEQVMGKAQSASGAVKDLVKDIDVKKVDETLQAVRSIAPEKFDKHAGKAVEALKGFLK